MWFNPFVAQIDVVCGTDTGFGASCQIVSGVTNTQGVFADQPGGIDQQFGVPRDSYWPRSLVAMVAISILLIVLSVQLVSPTRRWGLRLPGLPRRRPRPDRSAA